MFGLDSLARLDYLTMEVGIIGGALIFVVGFHFPILWRHLCTLALSTALVTITSAHSKLPAQLRMA